MEKRVNINMFFGGGFLWRFNSNIKQHVTESHTVQLLIHTEAESTAKKCSKFWPPEMIGNNFVWPTYQACYRFPVLLLLMLTAVFIVSPKLVLCVSVPAGSSLLTLLSVVVIMFVQQRCVTVCSSSQSASLPLDKKNIDSFFQLFVHIWVKIAQSWSYSLQNWVPLQFLLEL